MDLDKGINSEISYSISHSKQFVMSSNGTLILTEKLDHEQETRHVLNAVAKDGKWRYLYKSVGSETLKEGFHKNKN